MKKFLYILLFTVIFQGLAFADTQTFSIRNGIATKHGFIPTSSYGAYTSCDPFVMQVDREKYYMLINKGTIYNRYSLLGCDGGAKTDMFDPLREMNTDSNNRLSAQELKNANIRFVKVKNNGKLDVNNRNSDFNIDKIEYIDLSHLRFSLTILPNGSFDVYIKTDTGKLRKIIAKVSAKTPKYIDNLF